MISASVLCSLDEKAERISNKDNEMPQHILLRFGHIIYIHHQNGSTMHEEVARHCITFMVCTKWKPT